MPQKEQAHGICITISGPHGAGTSSVAKLLSKVLKLRLVSAGAKFREAAKQRGIPIANFNEILKKNPDIEENLDRELAIEAAKGNAVIEGRLSAWMAGDNADLRVYLTAPFSVRIRRIAEREGKTLDEIEVETVRRKNEAKEAFQKMHNIDIDDLSIYDIILNTEKFRIKDIVEIISAVLRIRE